MSESSNPPRGSTLRARSPRAPASQDLARGLGLWELPHDRDLETIFEDRDRIVGADAGVRPLLGHVPPPAGDPPPILDAFPPSGKTAIVVGGGLWIAPDLPDAIAARIHRHARTLLAMERGWPHLLSVVPLPEHPGLEPVAIAQMCIHGALDHPPVRIPLEDGWWPTGLTPGGRALVMLWRNRA